MYQKKFVSIYFSSDRIQIVKTNSKKTAVVKFSTFGLPPEAIENHKVKDQNALTEVIKKIWEQMKLRDKTVGLVVPEFATYTKTINLPILERQELDEAVRWQAQEQLPFEKGSAILDWQIVRSNENSNVVLVTAIARDVLTGYVDAVSKAGLYPLSVETPSISLIRILNNDLKKRLVIYNGNTESILLITEGRSITGSSVLNTNDEQTILKTAMQFIYHYSQGKIEQIYVGGVSFSQDFYPQLHQNLGGIQPQLLSLPIQGITPQQLQEYLVPLSQQMQDPQAPQDEKTTNLLPPSWVKHYEDQLNTRQAWMLSLIGTSIIWAGVAAVVIAFVILSTQLNNVRNNNAAQGQINDQVVKKVDDANAVITKMHGIATYDLYPQTYINVITKAKPASVIINNYDVNLEGGTATVNGFAPTRQDLVTFKEQLEQSGEFALVEVPISSLIAEENVEFTIDLTKEVVQQKKAPPKLKL